MHIVLPEQKFYILVKVNLCFLHPYTPLIVTFLVKVNLCFLNPYTPLIVTCHSIKQFHYTCSLISFLCCNFIVLISTYHSLIFFTIASLHFISSIQFKICCQNKSFRCSSLGNTYKTLHTVLCAFNHFTIILFV